MTKYISNEAVTYAYMTFRKGSQGFCKYIADRANINVTDEEVRRIADRAVDADEFMEIWENDTTWTDPVGNAKKYLIYALNRAEH